MKLLAGNSNRSLAEAIAKHLNLTFVKAVVRRFADMEVFVEIQENVRTFEEGFANVRSFDENMQNSVERVRVLAEQLIKS